jgi:ribose/xylose/arabinose/galactoside ABC-type transport system permease subunit
MNTSNTNNTNIPEAARVPGPVSRTVLSRLFQNELFGLLIALILIVGTFSVLSPVFLSLENWLNIGIQTSIFFILSCGMTIVILTRGIDLSVAAVLALASVLAAQSMMLFGNSPFLALLVGLAVGLVFGLLNGALVVYASIEPFLVTLGTMSMARGAALLFAQGTVVPVRNDRFVFIFADGTLLHVPLLILYSAAIFALVFTLLRTTRLGRNVYAVGGNPIAAVLSGINVKRIRIFAYAVSGLLAGFSGLIATGRLSAGLPNYGSGLELDAISAAVLGGTSFMGGKGSVVGTIIGAMIIAIIDNGLNLLGVNFYTRLIIKGGIIIAAMYWDHVRQVRLSGSR